LTPLDEDRVLSSFLHWVSASFAEKLFNLGSSLSPFSLSSELFGISLIRWREKHGQDWCEGVTKGELDAEERRRDGAQSS